MLVIILFAGLQRTLMYPASRSDDLKVRAFEKELSSFSSVRDVEMRLPCQDRIRGWHLQVGDSPSRHLAILFHGNGGNRAGRGGWYRLLARLGIDVLAVDYRGYGDSDGSPSEAALHEDADATWSYAVETLGYRPSEIMIVGESLGGGVAVQLASRCCQAGTSPHSLILVSTFSSMLEVACLHYPWLPVRWLLIDTYRSDLAIPKVDCPVLQFHGDQDEIVPIASGQKLFTLAQDRSSSGVPKRWVVMPGIGHNDVLYQNSEQLFQEIGRWKELSRSQELRSL